MFLCISLILLFCNHIIVIFFFRNQSTLYGWFELLFVVLTLLFGKGGTILESKLIRNCVFCYTQLAYMSLLPASAHPWGDSDRAETDTSWSLFHGNKNFFSQSVLNRNTVYCKFKGEKLKNWSKM